MVKRERQVVPRRRQCRLEGQRLARYLDGGQQVTRGLACRGTSATRAADKSARRGGAGLRTGVTTQSDEMDRSSAFPVGSAQRRNRAGQSRAAPAGTRVRRTSEAGAQHKMSPRGGRPAGPANHTTAEAFDERGVGAAGAILDCDGERRCDCARGATCSSVRAGQVRQVRPFPVSWGWVRTGRHQAETGCKRPARAAGATFASLSCGETSARGDASHCQNGGNPPNGGVVSERA